MLQDVNLSALAALHQVYGLLYRSYNPDSILRRVVERRKQLLDLLAEYVQQALVDK